MSLVSSIQDKAKNWLLSVAVKKGIGEVVMFAASWLASAAVNSRLSKYGVTVDQKQFQKEGTAGAMLVFEMGRNYLKQHYKWASWL